MRVSDIDTEARISFRPETGRMRISFAGGRCSGMPPFSNELLDLALGATQVTFDLSALHLTDPDSTIRSLLAALGTDESDPHVQIITADTVPDPSLRGSYHAG